ncbi:MAG: 2-oxoglutarate and iron-dependent oxygenase domain-containing protein, partial [Acidimicrobiia bacterium]
MVSVPVIDVGPLIDGRDVDDVAQRIDQACHEVGFFSVVNHGVDPALCARLGRTAHEFFGRPEPEKERIAMVHGGTAWRGWFPLHGELTSGAPDHKEGYYFGRELSSADARVAAGLPLHGPNLWPASPPDLRPTVLEYLNALEQLGQRLTQAISVGLGLGPSTLGDRWFTDPVILLRLFHYPATTVGAPAYGVGEHTDYGFLTMLWQDDTGGLEVHGPDGWVEIPPDPSAFVCNIGDMLDRLTAGKYRSTAHRVRAPESGARVSIPV